MFHPHLIFKWSPVALCLIPQLAAACSDDSCYPTWNLRRDALDTCNNVAFLSPSNDSRINLQLLVSNLHAKPIRSTVDSPDHYYRDLGYGLVPFPADSSDAGDDQSNTAPTVQPLTELATTLHVNADLLAVTKQTNDWSGSRCVSNNHDSALAFLTQLQQSPLSDNEKQQLAETRLQILQSCETDLLQQSGWRLDALTSAAAKEFVTYLHGAIAFYNGDFEQAKQQFSQLQESSQPWLKETSLYLLARTALNEAQQNAFDDMGYPANENVDKAQLTNAKTSFETYLKHYPEGQYAASAIGLLRRVDWLGGDETHLANAYAKELQQKNQPAGLIQEIDNKLLTTLNDVKHIQDPMLLATVDLMRMRHREEGDGQPAFTENDLIQQQVQFATEPLLYGYLQAAYSFYVDKDPKKTLSKINSLESTKDKNELKFSILSLQALALEANQQASDAEKIWKQLLQEYTNPVQKMQSELGLAMNYERNDRLKDIFAKHSDIHATEIRQILLRNVAGADLLRQQVEHPASPDERDVALFTLLYKNLIHGDYHGFVQDIEKITPESAGKSLNLGNYYGQQTLALFQWNGQQSEEYQCPSIKDVAQVLSDKPNDAKALNCLGDFVLRNGLDNFALNTQPASDELGGTQTQFQGTQFSRLKAYQRIMNDKNASHAEKGYATFRAINCFATSGYNSCDEQDIPVATRKQWFQNLKTRYKDTSWGQSLKYYW